VLLKRTLPFWKSRPFLKGIVIFATTQGLHIGIMLSMQAGMIARKPLIFGNRAAAQVDDQDYNSPGNAALMDNYSTGTPVRVFRGLSGAPPLYVYEGLYQVVDHRLEKSSDGPKVRRGPDNGVSEGVVTAVL
jgi:hypothetical protein